MLRMACALRLVELRRGQRLALVQLFADKGEAEDAALEAVSKARKERGFLFVLEEVELADDEVALLARMDQFTEARVRSAARAGNVGFRVHAADEQGIV